MMMMIIYQQVAIPVSGINVPCGKSVPNTSTNPEKNVGFKNILNTFF